MLMISSVDYGIVLYRITFSKLFCALLLSIVAKQGFPHSRPYAIHRSLVLHYKSFSNNTIVPVSIQVFLNNSINYYFMFIDNERDSRSRNVIIYIFLSRIL